MSAGTCLRCGQKVALHCFSSHEIDCLRRTETKQPMEKVKGLVERLRQMSLAYVKLLGSPNSLYDEAADALEALIKERDLAEHDKHERGNRIEALSAQQKVLVEMLTSNRALLADLNCVFMRDVGKCSEEIALQIERTDQALSSIGDEE